MKYSFRHVPASLGVLIASALAFGPAAAQVAKPEWKFEPVVLDSQDNGGATVGFKYNVSGSLWSVDLSDDGGVLDPTVLVGYLKLDYDGSGTVAAAAERNPENFLDWRVTFKGLYSNDAYALSGGAFVKFEADQSFDANQLVLGGHVTYGSRGVLANNDFVGLDLAFGRVEPGDDAERKTALGVAELEGYNRAEFEAVYIYPTGGSVIETVELNYRYYAEIDAPAAVQAADMDVHQIGTIRLGLPRNFFVAYSVGKLPFDRSTDETVQIGLSYKLF